MANLGKKVIVAALDGTYQKRPFGCVLDLVPLAESVIKLSAVCMMCKRADAAFSQRISSEREVEVIGGPEKYVALCRACYLRYTFVPFPISFSFPFPWHLHPPLTSLVHRPSHTIPEYLTQMDGSSLPAGAHPRSAPSTPVRMGTKRSASSISAFSTSSSSRRI